MNPPEAPSTRAPGDGGEGLLGLLEEYGGFCRRGEASCPETHAPSVERLAQMLKPSQQAQTQLQSSA